VKKRIFIIILILLLVGIGYVYASDQGWLPKNAPKLPIKNLPKISTDSASLNTIQKNAGSGLMLYKLEFKLIASSQFTKELLNMDSMFTVNK